MIFMIAQTYKNAYVRLKTFFNFKFINDIDRPRYSHKTSSEYRFNGGASY